MALVACRECGQLISTEAESCPHCGCPGPAGETQPVTAPEAAPRAEPAVSPFRSGNDPSRLPEVARWNWGAFLLTWAWALGHRLWRLAALFLIVSAATAFLAPSTGIGAVANIVPVALSLYLGIKGSELAWKARPFRDVEHFRIVQRRWAYWGVGFAVAVVVAVAALLWVGKMQSTQATYYSLLADGPSADAVAPPAPPPPSAPGFSPQRRPGERVSPAPELNPQAVVWRTPTPPANAQAADVWVNPRDGMEMVYIAPGEFVIGTSDAEIDAWAKGGGDLNREWFEWFDDERPALRLRVSGYWIGRTEVTNAQYLRFVQATRHRTPDHWEGGTVPAGLENFPVMMVDWDDARAYCEWAGGRLPREYEWEKAARGGDARVFPWGDQWDSRRCRNFEVVTGRRYSSAQDMETAIAEWIDSHDTVREGAARVGSYPSDASPYGCKDMAGNVMEWCADPYDEKAYERYERGDFTPSANERERVLRGGPWWMGGDPRYFRCASRHPQPRGAQNPAYGFRCVHDVMPSR